MESTTEIALKYFDYSNQKDFISILNLFSKDVSYTSAGLGNLKGSVEVVTKQKEFFKQYMELHWAVDSLAEISNDTVEIQFVFIGVKKDGTHVRSVGVETITIEKGKIIMINIRSKS